MECSVAALRSRTWTHWPPPAGGPRPGLARGLRRMRICWRRCTQKELYFGRIRFDHPRRPSSTQKGPTPRRRGSRRSGSPNRSLSATALSSSGGPWSSRTASRSHSPAHRSSRSTKTDAWSTSTTTGGRRKAAYRPGKAGALAQRSDVDLSVARAVEFAEEDPLPGAESELAVVKRHEDLRAHQRCTDVRRRIRAVGIFDVTPFPAVVDDLLQRRLEILGDGRIGVLVDRDPGRRVRHVDECGRRSVRRPEGFLHLAGDVHQLGAAVGLEPDLLHACRILRDHASGPAL